MKKTHKPGERFNAFQAKKKKHMKSYSESDMGSMAGYDPTGGLGNKGYAKATAIPKTSAVKSTIKVASMPRGKVPGGSFINGYSATKGSMSNLKNANSTKMMAKKKHSKNMKHKKNWIAGAIKKPGALHAELGVKQGNKIPAKTLAKAATKGGKIGARARLAQTLKGLHKKKEPAHKHKKTEMKCKTCGK